LSGLVAVSGRTPSEHEQAEYDDGKGEQDQKKPIFHLEPF